jgi:hypothetical protein
MRNRITPHDFTLKGISYPLTVTSNILMQKLPAIIVLCTGIAAIRLGWRGFFHGSIQFTSTKKITGTAAVTLGVIALLIGVFLSLVGFLTLTRI